MGKKANHAIIYLLEYHVALYIFIWKKRLLFLSVYATDDVTDLSMFYMFYSPYQNAIDILINPGNITLI
jgi:hypothetical protein